MPLKDLEVKYATRRQRPYKLSDGGGLHLLVQPRGAKLWRLKYRFDGKEKLLSFGKYPVVTLAIARAKRAEAQTLLANGKDPAKALAANKKPPPPRPYEPIRPDERRVGKQCVSTCQYRGPPYKTTK